MLSLLAVFVGLLSAFFGIIALLLAGFFVFRVCFSNADLIKSLVSAPVVGFGVVGLWLNLSTRIFSWDVAVYALSALGLFGFIWLLSLRKSCFIFLDDNRRLAVRVSLLFFLLLLLALLGGHFDESGHFPFAGLIANGHWPPRFAFEPSLPLVYHFSFDLVLAAFGRMGLWIPLASDLFVALLETSIVVLAWFFLDQFGLNRARRFGAVFFWFCAGSFGWILRPFRESLPPVLAAIPPFTSTIGNALGLLMYAKSHLFALGFFLLICIFYRELKVFSLKQALFFGVGTAIMAFSSETLFAVFVPVVYAALFFRADRRSRLYLCGAGLLCAVIVVLQGGVITDAFMAILGKVERIGARYTSFSFRDSYQFGIFGYPVYLNSGWTWLRFFLEWGGQIILFIFSIFAWRRWSVFYRFIIFSSILSFLLPFFVVYPAGPHDMLRLWGNAFFITNLLGAVVLAEWIRREWVWRGVVGLGSFGGFLSIILSNVPFIPWMAPVRPQIGSSAFWNSFIRHQDILPKNSRVWISVNRTMMDKSPFLVRQVPLVFGVYSRTCEDIYHRLVSDACESFYAAPSSSGLADLQVTHLLLSREWEDRYRHDPWFSRLVFIKRFEPSAWTSPFSSWLDLDPSSYALYVVH